MPRDLLIKWHFPHHAEKVWECLTVPELVSQWLMKNDFLPIVGHKFNFYTKPIPQMGFDGIVYCEVIEIIAGKKLVYTWKGGAGPDKINLDTILIWTLTPREDGTELVLEHKGFKGFKNYITSIIMNNGWRKHVLRRMGTLLDEIK